MKQLTGVVINTKMQKTAVVKVSRKWAHPLYKKIVSSEKKYLTHCEIKVKPEDKVIIRECKPVSKRKRWKVIKIV